MGRGGRGGRRTATTAVRLVALAAVTALVLSCTGGGEGAGGPGGSGSPGSVPGTTPPGSVPPPEPYRGFGTVADDGGVVSAFTGPEAGDRSAGFGLAIRESPFAISAAYLDRVFFEQPTAPDGGLYVVRGGARTFVTEGRPERVDRAGIDLSVRFSDGATGRVSVVPGGTPRTVGVRVAPDDPTGVTAWGMAVRSTPDELLYGLTERIVDDYVASEVVPQEVGSLNRRGERVTMSVHPTMSGYAPFYQSSHGYGLLVDGTMPGTYDLAASAPDRLAFEFDLDPQDHVGSFHLFHGPDHPTIVDQYTRLAGRPTAPPAAVYGHWRGRDEYPVGDPVPWHGIPINPTVAADLTAYEQDGLPPGILHFDRPWAVGPEGYGDFAFDPVRFPNAAAMLAELHRVGWKVEVWVAPWALGDAGVEAKAKGYLAPGSSRALDLTNPEAVGWLQARLVRFLQGDEGRYVDGLFLDRGDESDVPSSATDVYHDGRTGLEVHNAYPVLADQAFRQAVDRARPDGSGWVLARAAYTGSQRWVLRWGGDTPSREGLTVPEVPNTGPSTDLGLRSVLISLQRAAFMGTPFWGSDIGGYSPWIDREVYARWIEVGAGSPLMRFHGQGGTPWQTTTGGADPELLAIYQRYIALRGTLGPYLQDLGRQAATTGLPLARPLVFTWPDEPGARDRWDEWTLGPDLLVAPVWKSGARSRSVWFPPGRWVSWWDRTQVVEGPAEQPVDVPLDELPLYVRAGSPLEPVAAGSTG